MARFSDGSTRPDGKEQKESESVDEQPIGQLQKKQLNSEEVAAYGNRGECWLHLEEWEQAGEDLLIAQDMGANIVGAFHRDYKGGVKEFEEKTGIQMPNPVTTLLGY